MNINIGQSIKNAVAQKKSQGVIIKNVEIAKRLGMNKQNFNYLKNSEDTTVSRAIELTKIFDMEFHEFIELGNHNVD
tara:strand:- start:2109 stop:2339 length:231 start_codon:yes stop_codon:yes gene_type:complete